MPGRFCTKCGSALREDASFCTRCGARVAEQPLAAAAGAESMAESGGGRAPALQSVAATYATVSQAASCASTAVSLPWRTIAGAEPFDSRAFALAFAPVAQQAVRASLRKPAVALAVTSALDLGVAYLSGQPAAMQMVLVRFGMAGVTAVLGLVAGSKGGPLAKLTGAASAVTGLVQTVSFARTALAGVTSPATLLPLLPSAISQLSALAMAIKTAIAGFRS